MSIKFSSNYSISPKIASCLMRIEAAREQAMNLRVTPTVLSSLRETARLYTTHYSTMIEGNRLSANQIETVLKHEGHFPGREMDENEVKGYYAALTQLEKWSNRGSPINEKMIQTLHGLVMGDGRVKVKASSYRDGQNVIRDGRSGGIIYMPPEAKDVPRLMASMITWINKAKDVPAPIVAGIAHYQFATIHPYYDGNGGTARLLTTLILYLGGYDLKGLYSLEEYYARNLGAYYEAISVGESHNYYFGRAESSITKWVEYFVEGMVSAFENVIQCMSNAKEKGSACQSSLIRELDPRQRKVLVLFEEFRVVSAKQIAEVFGFKARSGAQVCKNWG